MMSFQPGRDLPAVRRRGGLNHVMSEIPEVAEQYSQVRPFSAVVGAEDPRYGPQDVRGRPAVVGREGESDRAQDVAAERTPRGKVVRLRFRWL